MGPSHARTSESDTPEQFFAPGLEMLSGDEASRSSPSFRSCSIGSAGSLSDNGGGGGRSEALVAFGGVQAWESVCATEYPSFARARLTASYCPSSRSTAASLEGPADERNVDVEVAVDASPGVPTALDREDRDRGRAVKPMRVLLGRERQGPRVRRRIES